MLHRPVELALFPPRHPNAAGTGHISTDSYSTSLRRWVARCTITDEHGRPAVVSPHRFRHTLGTRLINLDVPQEVVRRILDHDSHQMTAHYANPRELHRTGEKSQVAC